MDKLYASPTVRRVYCFALYRIIQIVDSLLNRKINQLFLQIAQEIYKSDLKNNDTKGWWPIRPTKLDYPIAPFIFSEIIRLFKKGRQQNISAEELAKTLNSKEVIMDLQYLWPSLGWKPTNISYEDKLFLIIKLIEIFEVAEHDENFATIFGKLAQEIKTAGNEAIDSVLEVGTEIYFGYLKNLYEKLDEDWEKALEKSKKLVLEKQDEVKDPGPWEGASQEKAVRKLVRNSDFRREKEKGLQQILQGISEVPGIAQGVVGENIIVDFTISSNPPDADAFITDIDAFKNSPIKEQLMEKGVVVISKTRNGSRQLQKGQKVLVDGTSGIVFGLS